LEAILIDQKTIEALQKLITGDTVEANAPLTGTPLVPYRSGPDLIAFFNQFCDEKEVYGQGFPSRWVYAQDKIIELKGTPKLRDVIERALDPRVFLGTSFSAEAALNYLNQFLEYDGYEVAHVGKQCRLHSIKSTDVSFDHAFLMTGEPNIEFIREQKSKCDQKIALGDFDGAITNSRSLLEAVLSEIEALVDGSEAPKYDGDLIKLYRRVQKLLKLEPNREDISGSLKQMLSGVVSIVSGIASVRNKMGDAHARSYRPSERHAKLAVNAVYTICTFLLESVEYQQKAGLIKLNGRPAD